jgi:hypothetical protein
VLYALPLLDTLDSDCKWHAVVVSLEQPHCDVIVTIVSNDAGVYELGSVGIDEYVFRQQLKPKEEPQREGEIGERKGSA